jgi:hypothetical protein
MKKSVAESNDAQAGPGAGGDALYARIHALVLAARQTVARGVDLAGGASLTLERATLRGLSGDAFTLHGGATLENVLVAAGGGRGVVIGGAGAVVNVRCSTIAGNAGAGIDAAGGGAVNVALSIVYGNGGADLLSVPCANVSWSDVGSPNCSAVNNNLSANPLLDGNFKLADGSPCIDRGPAPDTYTGTPCHDAAGERRLLDFDGDGLARIDLGAYERRNLNPTPAETSNVHWLDRWTLTWNPTPAAIEYHVYRGVVSQLSYASFGPCRDDLDPNRTDTQLTDGATPSAGASFFYEITAEIVGGAEGSLGEGACAERSNFTPCP